MGEMRSLSGDDAELKTLNIAVHDIFEILNVHVHSDGNASLNILLSALIVACRQLESKGIPREALLDRISNTVRYNMEKAVISI